MVGFCALLESYDENWQLHLLNEKQAIDNELNQEWNRQEEERGKRQRKKLLEEEYARSQQQASMPNHSAQPASNNEEMAEELEGFQVQNMSSAHTTKAPMKENTSPTNQDTNALDCSSDAASGRTEQGQVAGQVGQPMGEQSTKSLSLESMPTDQANQYTEGTVESFDDWLEERLRDPDGVLLIPSGESTIVRIPVPGPNFMASWEFAIIEHNINFGVSFEYSSNGQTVVMPVLPLLAQAASQQTVTGSHIAQHKGVYLLKFDNSYSYFRSKIVYCKVSAWPAT